MPWILEGSRGGSDLQLQCESQQPCVRLHEPRRSKENGCRTRSTGAGAVTKPDEGGGEGSRGRCFHTPGRLHEVEALRGKPCRFGLRVRRVIRAAPVSVSEVPAKRTAPYAPGPRVPRWQ